MCLWPCWARSTRSGSVAQGEPSTGPRRARGYLQSRQMCPGGGPWLALLPAASDRAPAWAVVLGQTPPPFTGVRGAGLGTLLQTGLGVPHGCTGTCRQVYTRVRTRRETAGTRGPNWEAWQSRLHGCSRGVCALSSPRQWVFKEPVFFRRVLV